MKRVRDEGIETARKRRALSQDAEPVINSRCRCPQSTRTPPSFLPTLRFLNLTQALGARQVDGRSQSIPAWIHNVSASCPLDDACNSGNSSQLDTMSDSSRLRGMRTQRCLRSCSPTKKSSQYRNTVLKPANILVDVIHTLPPDIEALLPSGLRGILSSAARPDAGCNVHDKELAERVGQLATIYRDECRELAEKVGSEPEYRTHLYGDVVEKLVRFPAWRCVLRANCSDKSWLASLKPPDPTPILSLPWPPLSARSVAMKPQVNTSFESAPHSFDSNIIRVRPDDHPFNHDSPPTSIEPSESSSSASELDGIITTPKPDITVGLSREVFSREHAGLLDYWQAGKTVLSDPHATQGDMRFPFLVIEAKGLTTNGNLIGAQNQAAGGGACAVRLLESLAAQDPEADVPRIVFSCTTEGAIHELWVHFQVVDKENIPKQHMVCLGVWRTTLDRHAQEFVVALSVILSWGVDVFFPRIKHVLDRVLATPAVIE